MRAFVDAVFNSSLLKDQDKHLIKIAELSFNHYEMYGYNSCEPREKGTPLTKEFFSDRELFLINHYLAKPNDRDRLTWHVDNSEFGVLATSNGTGFYELYVILPGKLITMSVLKFQGAWNEQII